MEYFREGKQIVVRLEKGEEVNASLEKLASEHELGFCAVSGIGALENVTLAYLGDELVKHQFQQRHEFMCAGNISLKDGKHFAHIHAWLGSPDKTGKVGHLVSGKVSVTCELVLSVFERNVKRKIDPATDYAVLDLNGHK